MEPTWADVHCIHPCNLPRSYSFVDEPIISHQQDTVPLTPQLGTTLGHAVGFRDPALGTNAALRRGLDCSGRTGAHGDF